MTDEIIRQKLHEWTNGSDPLHARVQVFERVRDIPYTYPASRDPVEVLQRGHGSCSGKHYVLGEMFRLLGLTVRHMLCRHRFNESPIVFPAPMQAMLRKNEILDFHDYLQVQVDGEWIDIDATWELALREFGFPVNAEWDGRRAMPLSVVADEHDVIDGDPERVKEEWLSKLAPRQRALRKQFLEALSSWVQELTAEGRGEASRG